VEVLHVLAVIAGILLALAITSNIVRTLVIPRARRTLLLRLVDDGVDAVFQLLVRPLRTYERKDQVLAAQGAVVLLAQLASWLLSYEVAYALMLWPTAGVGGLRGAFLQAGSSMFTLGFVYTRATEPTAIDVLAAATGIAVVALQIAYLPTLYGSFNRRETEVTLLGGRAGLPPWGPELLVRTRYGVAVKNDDLPAFYNRWERWAADVAESHSNYPVLVRFRSPRALSSWLVGLLCVMDSAAMLLALCPSQDRIEPRRAIRMGFTALRDIGAALGMQVNVDPDPDSDIALSFEEFSQAVDQLLAVGFPVERDAAEAWPHFRGWRVNYEGLAYGLARRTDQVPAPWSGPRRWAAATVPVQRPNLRSPGKGMPPKFASTDGLASPGSHAPGPQPAPAKFGKD
jgi:hypothetical protein